MPDVVRFLVVCGSIPVAQTGTRTYLHSGWWRGTSSSLAMAPRGISSGPAIDKKQSRQTGGTHRLPVAFPRFQRPAFDARHEQATPGSKLASFSIGATPTFHPAGGLQTHLLLPYAALGQSRGKPTSENLLTLFRATFAGFQRFALITVA